MDTGATAVACCALQQTVAAAVYEYISTAVYLRTYTRRSSPSILHNQFISCEVSRGHYLSNNSGLTFIGQRRRTFFFPIRQHHHQLLLKTRTASFTFATSVVGIRQQSRSRATHAQLLLGQARYRTYRYGSHGFTCFVPPLAVVYFRVKDAVNINFRL